MNDDDEPNVTGSASGFWLTDILQSDVTMLRMAGERALSGADAETGALAARRTLDGLLRVMSGWPRPEDYDRMAADYEAAGRAHEAALLRQVAATGELQAEARPGGTTGTPAAGRHGRRDDRQHGRRRHDRLRPRRPVPGHRRGGLPARGGHDHRLAAPGRDGRQPGRARASGRLGGLPGDVGVDRRAGQHRQRATGPAADAGRDRFRPWREEQVLARMLEAPAEVPALAAGLPPDTFTADVRYDIYAAILTVTSRGQRPDAEEVAVELNSRLAWLPDHALPAYGGPAGRTAQAYLSRLLRAPSPATRRSRRPQPCTRRTRRTGRAA